MAFQLSPGTSVREINLTGYVPNIPSAKTGMVLRADQGPALDVTAITNENDLVSVFGKPTASNFQDWYQAWNFLQYASSLYVVRPIDANLKTENAGIGISFDSTSSINKPNFFNSNIAQNSLDAFSDVSDALYFINKEVTSNQRLAVAVCSSPSTFKSQLGLEFYAVADVVDGSKKITTVGAPTLTNGSQVIFNGNKLANVISVNQTSQTAGEVTFDRNVTTVDVDAFFATPATSATTEVVVGSQYTGTFYKEGFTFKLGTKIRTSGSGALDFVVTSVANNTDSKLVDVNFVITSATTSANPGQAPVFVKDEAVSSSEVFFRGTTAYNNVAGSFGINAGDTSISLQPGFILEAGVQFAIGGITGVTFTVASVDNTLNKINLVSPSPSAIGGTSGLSLAINPSQFTINKLLLGVNYFDKVYDQSLIKKTRRVLTDASGANVNLVAQSLVSFSAYFEYQPTWSNDEFIAIVLRKNDDGYYEKVEAFTVSYNPLAKNTNGANIFVENVFNKGSKYLYAKVGDKTAVRPSTSSLTLAKIVGDVSTIYPQKVEFGKTVYNGFGYTKGDVMQAFALFADPEQFDVNILQAHELDINYASTITETRKDCIAVVGPYDSTYLSVNTSNNCTEYLLDNFGSQTEFDSKIFTSFGTYSAFYGNMKYQYDKYNNVNRWINVAGDVAGLYAATDNVSDPWYAPAGTTRGIIKNAIKLAFNPNKANRDALYVNAINPIMAIPGEGSAVVWGQKTATATPSAMDRVNVRRLLIHLEKSIAIATNVGIFEFNDTFTRTRLFNVIDPFLRSVKARRGLYEYKIVIDESNNTPDVIDQNGLAIDIYLQPTKVAEFIRVTCAVLPTGANFSEYVGSF